jgi:helix-turn-helix protein
MSNTQEHSSDLLTEKEAGQFLRLCPRALINWRNRGIVPYIRLGTRAIRYRRSSLVAMLERMEKGGSH